MTDLLCRAAAQRRVHAKGSVARGRLGPTLGSVVLASLLLCEMAAAMVGAEAVFFSTLVAALLVLPAVVGPKSVLDAGCFYMLISLGIVVVVSVASNCAGLRLA